MRQIVYSMLMSLDGYIEDRDGAFGFSVPDAALHAYINTLEAGIDTHIYGRRLYELMNAFWPTAGDDPDAPPEVVDYARIWNRLDKLVFSRTLKTVDGRARLATEDIGAEIARLKALPGRNISVGGAQIANAAIARGLVDLFQIIVCPVLVGGGKPMFDEVTASTPLRLTESRTFSSGAVVLHYETLRGEPRSWAS